MTDRDVVYRKLTSLREQAARLRRRREGALADFLADVDRQDALAMSLLVAVQEAADIALHMAADEGWGVPASYGEAFGLLRDRGVLEPGLAASLGAMASLRNRIAHGYATVEIARIWNELPDGLTALDRFAAAVATRLGPA